MNLSTIDEQLSTSDWLRWVSTRGEKGPLVWPEHGKGSWSEPVSATIPG